MKRVKDSGISSVFNKSYKDIDEWPSTGCIQSLGRSERGGAGSLGGQESRYDNRYHYVRNYLKKQVSERFKGRVNLEKVVEVLSPPRPDSGLLAGIMMIKAAIPSAPSVQAYKYVYIHGSLVVDSRLHTSSYRRQPRTSLPSYWYRYILRVAAGLGGAALMAAQKYLAENWR